VSAICFLNPRRGVTKYLKSCQYGFRPRPHPGDTAKLTFSEARLRRLRWLRGRPRGVDDAYRTRQNGNPRRIRGRGASLSSLPSHQVAGNPKVLEGGRCHTTLPQLLRGCFQRDDKFALVVVTIIEDRTQLPPRRPCKGPVIHSYSAHPASTLGDYGALSIVSQNNETDFRTSRLRWLILKAGSPGSVGPTRQPTQFDTVDLVSPSDDAVAARA
jgi:hypothetical protein